MLGPPQRSSSRHVHWADSTFDHYKVLPPEPAGLSGPSTLVEQSTEFAARTTSSVTEGDGGTVYRQFSQRVGGNPQCSPYGPRFLGPGNLGKVQHQLARAQDNAPWPGTLSRPSQEQVSDDQVGQSGDCLQPDQTGGDTLPGSLLSGMGDPPLLQRPPHHDQSTTSDGGTQCDRRPAQPSIQGDSHGVDFEQERVQSRRKRTRRARTRLVRHVPEQPASGLCEPVSGPSGASPGRSQLRLEHTAAGLRVSTHAHSTQSATEDTGFHSHSHPDSTGMADTVLVSRPAESPHPTTGGDSSTRRPPHATGGPPSVDPPQSGDVQLSRLDVVRDSLTQRGFSEAAAQRIAIPQKGSTRTVYDGKWAEFCRWCSGQQKDPIRATVPVVADFLIHLFDRTPPLAVSTIRGYRSAIARTIPDGFRITESKEISNLFRSLGVDRPVTRTFYPKWSLKIVLNYLLKEPFEHISKCSLENLTLKTVFLVTLASGRRRSEIHALSVDPECFRFSPNLSQVSLLTEPGFLSKTQKTSKMPAKIVIQSLAKHVGHDLPDYALCPVRAPKAYKDKTKSEAVRKNRKRLFIPYRDSQDDIKPHHISKWIVELVKRAHRDANDDAYQLANVTAHEVRAIATSWAVYNNAPFEEIMQAADWSGNTTFTSFYSRAMAAHAEGLYDLGPIVSAQRVVHRPPSPSGT